MSRSLPRTSMLHGASLLEILAVIGIISLSALVSLPLVNGSPERVSVMREAKNISSTIKSGIAIAMRTEQNFRAQINLHSILLSPENSDSILIRIKRSPGVTVQLEGSIMNEPLEVRISRHGFISPLTLRLSNGSYSCKLILSLHGRARGTCE